MIEYRYFRSSSFLLIVDNMAEKYSIRWIDFNYVDALVASSEDSKNAYDENTYSGLANLLSILKEMK